MDTTCIIYLCSTHSKDCWSPKKNCSVLCQKKVKYAGYLIMFNDDSQKRNVRKKVGHCVHLNFFAILFIFTHCSEVVFFIYCMRIYVIYHLIHDFYALICAALYCLFFFCLHSVIILLITCNYIYLSIIS